MQLVAVGAQDGYLTGDPKITFFRSVYKQHTPFAIESVQQVNQGTVDFGKRFTVTVSRHGDLVGPMYLEVDLPDLTGLGASYINHVGHALIKSCEVEIGGTKIDKIYGEWLQINNELTQTSERREGYNRMVGSYDTVPHATTLNVTGGKLYIPLNFWFTQSPSSAIPLIQLTHHDVKIHFQLRPLAELVRTPPLGSVPNVNLTSADLWCDYFYVSQQERARFTGSSSEYLIRQVQYTGSESIPAGTQSTRVRIHFNHPCVELVWVLTKDSTANEDIENGNQWFDFGSAGDDYRVNNAKLMLNSHDRFQTRDGSYFAMVQPYQHHTRVPSAHIYVYSFALQPERWSPSGSANLSRIDNTTLSLGINSTAMGGAGKLHVFAVNYNVLRLVSGMGGLAYSN